MKQITLKGVKENNLKDIDIDIPRGEVTILTGISGSGKSTLAFDTIFADLRILKYNLKLPILLTFSSSLSPIDVRLLLWR